MRNVTANHANDTYWLLMNLIGLRQKWWFCVERPAASLFQSVRLFALLLLTNALFGIVLPFIFVIQTGSFDSDFQQGLTSNQISGLSTFIPHKKQSLVCSCSWFYLQQKFSFVVKPYFVTVDLIKYRFCVISLEVTEVPL